jgi:hypothetical protein
MTKAKQAQLQTWRVKVLQHAGAGASNVARTCRLFGIPARRSIAGNDGLRHTGAAGLCDRPRTPHRSPRATTREVVSKIPYLRQNYHFVPSKIADYLKRFHRVLIATSSVHLINTMLEGARW